MSEEQDIDILKLFKCDPNTHLNLNNQGFIEKIDETNQILLKSLSNFESSFQKDIAEIVNNEKKLFQSINIDLDYLNNEILNANMLNHELKVKRDCVIKSVYDEKFRVKATSNDINDLIQDVVLLENEKEKLRNKLIKERDTILKLIKYYKKLDISIEYESPNIYKFILSIKKPSKWITMAYYDESKDWTILDTTLGENVKKVLIDVLINGNPVTMIEMAKSLV